MNKSILVRLILPLTFLFVLALIANTYWKADGFFINLATEIVGIIVTISYVNWVLQKRSEQEWKATDTRVINRLMILLHRIITYIRTGLKISTDFHDYHVIEHGDYNSVHNEIIRVGEKVIYSKVYQQLRLLNQLGWQTFSKNIQKSHDEITSFIDLFQSRLTPEQISGLLDIQEILQRSLFLYTAFPDLVGVPEEDLPNTITPPKSLQQLFSEGTSKEIQMVIKMISKLSETISADTTQRTKESR